MISTMRNRLEVDSQPSCNGSARDIARTTNAASWITVRRNIIRHGETLTLTNLNQTPTLLSFWHAVPRRYDSSATNASLHVP